MIFAEKTKQTFVLDSLEYFKKIDILKFQGLFLSKKYCETVKLFVNVLFV